jgi:hypothetical protein
MRNSISVALVVIAICISVVATFTANVAIAHGADLGIVRFGGSTGLALALVVGLMGLMLKPTPVVRSSVASVVMPMATSWPIYVHEVQADFFEGFVPGEEGFDARVVATWTDVMPVSCVRDMAGHEDLPFVARSFLRNGAQCTSTVYLRKG